MAPHSSTLAWKIPWMEEPGRLQSMGSRRVGPDWTTSLSLFTFLHWRRKWQPTPVGSQCEELRPWQRSWGRKLGIRKGVIKPQETPCSWASTPKTRVFYGELSPITISLREGVNLQVQLIKIPGRDKSVSTYELWRFSGLPDQARPATCDCLQPPKREKHKML